MGVLRWRVGTASAVLVFDAFPARRNPGPVKSLDFVAHDVTAPPMGCAAGWNEFPLRRACTRQAIAIGGRFRALSPTLVVWPRVLPGCQQRRMSSALPPR